VYRDFSEIVAKARASQTRRVLAVAAAEDEHVIEAVLKAQREGIADAILVGDAARIRELIRGEGGNPADFEFAAADSAENAGQTAVALVRDGKADILMKGRMETRDLLKPVVDRENNLHTGRVMSHMAFNKLPNYPKLIVNTDGGMVVYPSLEDKKNIIINAVTTLCAMGYVCPKVAVLAGVEKVNPKMVETVEADQLKQMNRNGEITNCVVEGPLSYDIAMDAQIARYKGSDCPHSGDFDVLVMPNLAAGNILGKSWTVTAQSVMAGIIVGAKIPVVIVSRGSGCEEKYLSIALAAVAAEHDQADSHG
jgi:phosphate butyryltransferase